MAHLLIVDDDANTLASLARAFRLAGHEATVCDNAARALELVKSHPFDMMLSDVVMPGKDGLALLEDLRDAGIGLPVVMISGQASIEMAVRATRLGAIDFLEKPLSTDKLLLTVDNVLKLKRLENENRELRQRVGKHEIVHSGEAMRRVMEEGQVERVGGDRAIPVNVRVIVATHRNLDELVKKGVFRQDLYHRIYVFPLCLPALRERADDIPPLVRHFGAQVAEINGWKPRPITPAAIEELARYPWPGNVRELRNVVERLLLLADGPVDAAAVRLALPGGAGLETAAASVPLDGPLAARVDAFEREQILAELKRHNQRMTDTAKA